jgi:hypothetical protein
MSWLLPRHHAPLRRSFGVTVASWDGAAEADATAGGGSASAPPQAAPMAAYVQLALRTAAPGGGGGTHHLRLTLPEFQARVQSECLCL